MNPDLWIHVALTIVMAMASTIFWFWANGQNQRFAEIDRRFNDANALLSKLTSHLQAMATRADMEEIDRSLRSEHAERMRLIEVMNVAIGALQTEIARIQERSRANEIRLDELWRRQFRTRATDDVNAPST